MTFLGEAFSESDRQRFAERAICQGTVIKRHVQNTIPPKEKRFIIISESYDRNKVCVVYFNTDINTNVLSTPYLQSLNLLFGKDGRKYLDHDCYVDCSEIFEMSKTSLIEFIKNNPDRVLGELADDDYKKVRTTIVGSKSITAGKKKTFGLFYS